MQKRAQQLKKTVHPTDNENDIVVSRLLRLVEDWLADSQIRQHSPRTIELRQTLTGRLHWFLEEHHYTHCGKSEMKRFFAYLTTGHQGNQGRWNLGTYSEPLRPTTVATYYHHLRAFFNWLVEEQLIADSPMEAIKPPTVRTDQIRPFTKEQVEAIIAAARKSKYAKRDEAIVRFLLDTGIRATELCNLRRRDVNEFEGHAYVLGKGNKKRMVCVGRKTLRALRAYLRTEDRRPDEPLFISERGVGAGAAFTRSGLRQLIERLGISAKIQSVRCSPHTFRHTFAVEFLRAGGNVFSLKQLLGHEGLQITNRYVALAQQAGSGLVRMALQGDS